MAKGFVGGLKRPPSLEARDVLERSQSLGDAIEIRIRHPKRDASILMPTETLGRIGFRRDHVGAEKWSEVHSKSPVRSLNTEGNQKGNRTR